MSEIIKFNSSTDERRLNLIDIGAKIYRTGGNFAILADLMENPEFRRFYRENFNDWSDIKTVVTFMRLYEHVERVKPQSCMLEKIAYIDMLMNDTKSLKTIMASFS
jgi:hypothetical protein